jgi:hypothetical protein
MSVILADAPGNGVPPSAIFSDKGYKLVCTKLSNLSVVGIPAGKQIAYAGYKDGIEAFVKAGLLGRRVALRDNYFALPEGTKVHVPLSLPPVVVQIARKLSPAGTVKFETSVKDCGFELQEKGAGNPVYTLESLSVDKFRGLARICERSSKVNVSKHAQLVAIPWFIKCSEIIEGFLRVNNYSFDPDYEKAGVVTPQAIQAVMELRTTEDAVIWTAEKNRDVAKAKIAKTHKALGAVDTASETTDYDAEAKDDSDLLHVATYYSIGGGSNIVVVANPGQADSCHNWGPPNSVPHGPGLVFPYYPGMLIPDVKALIQVVGETFFRNLGIDIDGAKTALKEFREQSSTIASTQQGMAMSHIFYGIRLALETQARLFLLYDDGVYLGFTLLGKRIAVRVNNTMVHAVSEEELKIELKKVQTTRVKLEQLGEQIGRCKDAGGDLVSVDLSKMTSPVYVAHCLSQIQTSREGKEDPDVVKVTDMLKNLVIKPNYKRLNQMNVLWAVEQMTTGRDDPFPADQQIHIPTLGWSKIGTKDYAILASFGTESFSFRFPSGIELAVPRDTDVDPYDKKDGEGNYIHNGLYVRRVTISEALAKWEEVKSSGILRIGTERSKGNSSLHIERAVADDIWKHLKRARKTGIIARASDIVDPSVPAKRTATIAFGDKLDDDALDF